MIDEHSHKSVTILAVAILGFSLFQMTQILADGGSLNKAKAQTETNIVQADKVLAENQKMLDQLNAVAIATQKLADSGNANAKNIVAQLQRLGIRINPDFKPGQPAATAPAGEGAAPPPPPPQAAPAPPPPAPPPAKP